MKKVLYQTKCVFTLFFAIVLMLTGCSKKAEEKKAVAVFVPGIVSGSPVYEMLVKGVQSGIEEYNAALKDGKEAVKASIIEAGPNQAEWAQKLTATAATGEYSIIISSNPSLPELAVSVAQQFPEIKFIILDSHYEGNAQIFTVQYNQREQAYLAGYAAGLVTTADKDSMQYANAAKKIALVAAQEYPVMNNVIFPGFAEGAKAVDSDITVDFRIVGNWYDATKGAELARSLSQEGVDVILPIAGGASQGVLSAAKELGFYVTWFDDDGYAKAPGYVVSSTALKQDKMAEELTLKALKNEIKYGEAETVGIAEGYVEFVEDSEIYVSAVAEEIRNKISEKYSEIKEGKLLLK